MYKKIFLIVCFLFYSGHLFSKTLDIKKLVVINWTDEELVGDDILMEYIDDNSRTYSWNQTLEEYSAKTVDIDTTVTKITVKGKFSSPVLPVEETTSEVVLRQSGKMLTVSLIRESSTNQILGLNICNNQETFGRIRHFVIVNFTSSKVLFKNIRYTEGNRTVTVNMNIEPYTIELYPLETQPLAYNNWEFVEGKAISGYTMECLFGYSCPTNKGLKYGSIDCVYGEDQQMLVGVEISNSGIEKIIN